MNLSRVFFTIGVENLFLSMQNYNFFCNSHNRDAYQANIRARSSLIKPLFVQYQLHFGENISRKSYILF